MAKTQMFDPNTFTEGGGQSLKGVEGVIVSSMFKWTNWAKKDGSIPTYNKGRDAGQPVKPSTVLELKVKSDDLDDPITALITTGGVLLPSKDAVLPAKDMEGTFLVHSKGGDATVNKQSGLSLFIESLSNASFDYNLLNEHGFGILEGYRMAFEETVRKDPKTGKPVEGSKPVTVVSKIIHGPGTSAKAGQRKMAAPTKKAAPAPTQVAGNGEDQEVDAETLVTEIISEILSAESPLPKAKVSVQVNKKLAELGLANEDRLAALKLATSNEFLSAGPWSYDNKSLAAL